MQPIALSVRDLSWGPHPPRMIVRDVSFDVAAGSTTVIVGPNGAGKSTILRSLYRQNRPLAGHVLADGEDLWRMPARQVARSVAAVLQEATPDFHLTTRDMVAMGRIPHRAGRFGGGAFGGGSFGGGREDARIVDAMLEEFDLTGLAARPFSGLSGGEKQRAFLARALVQQPRLLILDEPTNHLDIRHQLEIVERLRRMPMTVIVTLHDLNLAAALADQVLVVRNGRLLARGPAGATLTPAIIRAAFDVDADVAADPVSGRPRLSFFLPTGSP